MKRTPPADATTPPPASDVDALHPRKPCAKPGFWTSSRPNSGAGMSARKYPGSNNRSAGPTLATTFGPGPAARPTVLEWGAWTASSSNTRQPAPIRRRGTESHLPRTAGFAHGHPLIRLLESAGALESRSLLTAALCRTGEPAAVPSSDGREGGRTRQEAQAAAGTNNIGSPCAGGALLPPARPRFHFARRRRR